MWSLTRRAAPCPRAAATAPLLHLASVAVPSSHLGASAICARTAPLPLGLSLSLTLNTLGGTRHGSQSARAGRAASRASGGTYRTPKGRPGPNTFHITTKEPLPQVTRFADARLPRDARRKATALARKLLPPHERIDFEVAGGEVVPLRGKNSQKKQIKRVKTAVHKAIRLARAREEAAAQQTGGLDWNEDEQLAAEAEADRFLAAERAALEAEREAFLANMESEQLSDADRQHLLDMFDAEVKEAQDAAEAELAKSATKRPRTPKQPVFGIQTVLKFLAEFDVAVRVPTKAKKTKKRDASDESVAAPAATQPPVDTNPLNQDVLVYDVISRFAFADYIVVVKAQSARQMRHLAESAYKMARSLNACSANPRVLSLEGRGREDWMLVDAGSIWMYFFNRTPVATLPTAAGIFGVSFQVPQTSVHLAHSHHGQRGGASDDYGRQASNGLLTSGAGGGGGNNNRFTEQHQSVTFSAYHNPFDPTPAATTAAANPVIPAHLNASPVVPASIVTTAVSDADDVHDPMSELHETSSQINSTMWYEPTPDNPSAKKKSQVNQAAQQAQMAQGHLDPTFADNSSRRIIDASFTATSSPLRSAAAASMTSSHSAVDPSLALLHASHFTHAVLENLEKHYGDLRVPTERVAKLKDYAHEDLKNDVALIGADKKKVFGAKGKRRVAESIEIQNVDATTTVVSSGAGSAP